MPRVAEVVSSSIVVDFVDTEVALEQRGHKHKRRYKALPKAEPEARDSAVFTRRSFALVSAWRASGQNAQQH
jgi:hypothetical protein